jgi:hypothetical protein
MTNVIYSTDKQWRVTSCDKNTVGLLLWPYLKNHIFLVPVNYVYRGRYKQQSTGVKNIADALKRTIATCLAIRDGHTVNSKNFWTVKIKF